MADNNINPVSAVIKDGKIENLDTKKASKDMNTAAGYDKDSFLKILVAQMKYQDPMEPTSNTEYISQYATFTQVEQLSNMANAMSMSRASEMVGKTVTIKQVNAETGKTSEIQGVVDMVTYSGNKAYLTINGNNYSIDDVTEVLNSDYVKQTQIVEDLQKNIDGLPRTLDLISLGEHGEKILTMYDYYNNLDDKTKNLIDKDYVTALTQYKKRVDELNDALGEFEKAIENLPKNEEDVTLEDHGEKVDELYKYYMALDSATKQVVEEDYKTALQQYVDKIDELRGDTHRVVSKQ
ncbi:flagellar hook capping FlgD N-terminal domain-containing protein [Butyrivibrio sp. INlla21]|uniref:flagellar hook capping FlgD N-terminal domain-containing protein n=1 Tax=Butyrivibrio sp. INlla21 TaxID=1520811 RepID=UPI0008E3E729|nr:flagellar hook capping FlgD N-terminal domain-containing protein [Butyrivibrio sp. INlla21]SFU40933.1 flagellar basal-body rod modification protein FlgD [Butyrivibrio sp. INlla21]